MQPAGTKEGFTLVEIVVILIIAAIILPAVILPFVETSRDFHLPVIRGTLALLAQEEMESKIICRGYDEIEPWSATEISGFPGYFSSCAVAQPAAGIKEVTVTVSREDESFSLVTLRTDVE